MSVWTTEMVHSFLLSQGFDRYVDAFERNDVDGEVLMKLTRGTLKSELGIESLGAREKIIKAIDSMRIRQQSFKRPASPSRPGTFPASVVASLLLLRLCYLCECVDVCGGGKASGGRHGIVCARFTCVATYRFSFSHHLACALVSVMVVLWWIVRPQSAGSMRGRSASPMQSPGTRTLSIGTRRHLRASNYPRSLPISLYSPSLCLSSAFVFAHILRCFALCVCACARVCREDEENG